MRPCVDMPSSCVDAEEEGSRWDDGKGALRRILSGVVDGEGLGLGVLLPSAVECPDIRTSG